jgi:hypothetical protein
VSYSKPGLVKVTSDDDDWISHSRGQVQLVILINFEEDVHHRKEYHRSQQSKDRVQTLLRDFGNSVGRTGGERRWYVRLRTVGQHV